MIEQLLEFLRIRGVDFATIEVVFDIGSRDGVQAIEFSRQFPEAHIVAIECNPNTLDRCRRNIATSSRITLIDKAVNSYSGRCVFYPIDPLKTTTTWKDGNPGASSLFVANGEYPVETYVQDKVEVDCVRLDDLCKQHHIHAIDIIWMDLQGAELLALQSAGDLLDKVRYIYTEVSHRPIYEGQCLFDDVEAFLNARGFRRCTKIDTTRWQQDAIYENTRELIDVVVPSDPGELDTLNFSVRSVRNFVADVRNIYVVGAENPGIEGVNFIDERNFPFNIHSVRQQLDSHARSGLYFQQLIKLYFPLIKSSCLEHVLAVEADTIFLHPCRFIDGRRPVFNFGDEYHAPFFEHMARLYPPLYRMFAYSGVTHCMMFKRAWLNEIHMEVEAHHPRLPFWESYLRTIDPAERERGASEYEIYFHFCLMFHASDVTIRRFRWSNATSIDDVLSEQQDYVSLRNLGQKGPSDWRRLEHLLLTSGCGSC